MSFWEHHGWLALFGLAVFPRITLFLAFPWGGWLWWTGWVMCPHVLVAILSLDYWNTDPVLVVIAWLFAIFGTLGEWGETNRRFP